MYPLQGFCLRKADVCLVSALLLAFLPINAARIIVHNDTDALEGWDDLAKDAGYFTQKGRWKGGLPRLHRSTDYENYVCQRIHTVARFCVRWTGQSSQRLADRTYTEACDCTMNNDMFCQAWECRDRNQHISSCTCLEGDSGEIRVCPRWSCLEYSIRGSHEMQDFVCLHHDPLHDHCLRWRGNITAQRYVKSRVCDCYGREEGFCGFWLCEERTVTRCAVLKNGMCDTGFAVGVYGGCGLFFILLSMAWCGNGVYRENDPIIAVHRLQVGCLLGFPWMIGVALTGGVYAIGWVFLLWGVPIFFFATCMIKTSKPLRNYLTSLKPTGWKLWKPR